MHPLLLYDHAIDEPFNRLLYGIYILAAIETASETETETAADTKAEAADADSTVD